MTRETMQLCLDALANNPSISIVEITGGAPELNPDQLDKELNALKSGGGIHTQEKLLVSMADQFVLIGDETKLVDNFDNRFPVVIELLPEAAAFVPGKIQNLFPGSGSSFRISDKKDGHVITDNGNHLLDVWFQTSPDLATNQLCFKNCYRCC